MAKCGKQSEGRKCVIEKVDGLTSGPHYGPVHHDDTNTAWWDDSLPLAKVKPPAVIPATDPDDDGSM